MSVPPATAVADSTTPTVIIDSLVTISSGTAIADNTSPDIVIEGDKTVGVSSAVAFAFATFPTVLIRNEGDPEPQPPGEVVGAHGWGAGGGGMGGRVKQEGERSFLDDILDCTVEVEPATAYAIATILDVKTVNYVGEKEDEELILMAMAKFGMLGELSHA